MDEAIAAEKAEWKADRFLIDVVKYALCLGRLCRRVPSGRILSVENSAVICAGPGVDSGSEAGPGAGSGVGSGVGSTGIVLSVFF